MAAQNISTALDDLETSKMHHTPSKILCCNKVQHHKIPISNNPESQEALDWFKLACGGNLPNDTHDPSKRVFWWAYKELYCVVSNGSRGSKKFKAVNFYGLSITAPGGKEVQKVTLIPESTVLAEKIKVVGASKAKDAAGRGIPCLVRAQGGMELSCKKHLDTIYTVYRVHYQGIRGTQRLGKGKDEDQLAESRRKHMQSRKELMSKSERALFEKETIPGELYGPTRQEHINSLGTEPEMFMFQSDDIYEPAKLTPEPETIPQPHTTVPGFSGSTGLESIASKIFEKVPLDEEQYPAPISAMGIQTPAHTPEPTSIEKVPLDVEQLAPTSTGIPVLLLPRTGGLITPVRTPTSTVPPSLPTPKPTPITPSKRKTPSTGTPLPGVKMVSCSRHSWLVPEAELGMNPRTGEPFKTCERCRRKNRRGAARARGDELSDEE